MEREEILERSRRENGHRDLAELEVCVAAGNIAGRVGCTVCCLLSLLSLRLAGTILFSPWVICFSIHVVSLRSYPNRTGTSRCIRLSAYSSSFRSIYQHVYVCDNQGTRSVSFF